MVSEPATEASSPKPCSGSRTNQKHEEEQQGSSQEQNQLEHLSRGYMGEDREGRGRDFPGSSL